MTEKQRPATFQTLRGHDRGHSSCNNRSRVTLLATLILAAFILLTTNTVSVAKESPPNFTLDIPKSFSNSAGVEHYRKGEDTLNAPPFHLITAAPRTLYHGWYGRRTTDLARAHSWGVSVYALFSPKVATAYASAKDGFQADLDEAQQFLGSYASPQTYARFERKQFRWGNAVSFLNASYQEMPHGEVYVPDNGHLRYEVWGVTRDQQFTMVASVSVSHPKLANWTKLRVVQNIEALKKDRDYNFTRGAAQRSSSLASLLSID